MILIADSGSTKTDWCVTCDGKMTQRLSGQGINPFMQTADTINDIISNELISHLENVNDITEVYFYGAGCREEKRHILAEILRDKLKNVKTIDIETDLTAAARALFGQTEGIACILGTGSNSGYYDGYEIRHNISPLGYILGDEGSGAVLGKLFVNALYKGRLSDNIVNTFETETGLTLTDIIENVYRRPLANRFLASLSPFIARHIDDQDIENIVIGNFTDFFRRNINKYQRKDIAIGAIGSIAYHYGEQLKKSARTEGYSISKIIKSPMEGLINYHASQNDMR
ncbi:MAG: ATPase [Prevotella sp.]